jgi:hypothetical protein
MNGGNEGWTDVSTRLRVIYSENLLRIRGRSTDETTMRASELNGRERIWQCGLQ